MCCVNYHHLAVEQETTIFFHPLRSWTRVAMWAVSNVISSSLNKLVSVVCETGRKKAGGQDVIFYTLAHVFASSLSLADEGCVQEISVAGILLAAVVVFCL